MAAWQRLLTSTKLLDIFKLPARNTGKPVFY